MTYTPPTVTVDGIVFQLMESKLCVALIQRSKEPFKGVWALPGSYVSNQESVAEGLTRTLQTKAGIDITNFGVVEQLYTFDTAAFDPRGHAVSVTYLMLGKDVIPEENEVTESPKFFPVDDLPKLMTGHDEMIRYATMRLRSKVTYTNAVFALLSKQFTLTQLQVAYESILGRSLDKRNFRKKILSLGFITETEDYIRDKAYRPARLYTFKSQNLEVLSRSFE